MTKHTSDFEKHFRSLLQKIPICDTHEHFPSEAERLRQPGHFGNYWHYVMEDMTKAGMPRQMLEKVLNDYASQSEETIDQFWRFWSFCRNTGYGSSMRLFFRELFGIDEISRANVLQMNATISERVQPGWYESVLERANIKCCVRTVWSLQPTMCDLRRLFPAPIFDHFALVRSVEDIQQIEVETAIDIRNFDSFLSALEDSFRKRKGEGMVAIKIFLAYRRALDIEPASRSDAERQFDGILAGKFRNSSLNSETKAFEDFIMHAIVEHADALKLPIQIHTGFQNGTFQVIQQGNPLLLTQFLMAHPHARFDLFHGGFPYINEYATLCKTFPNVTANMAWLYIVSPTAAKSLLNLLLDTVPANRIHGFGGDYDFVEGAFSHAKIARDAIAEVLAQKVLAHDLSETEAQSIARQILWESPAKFYNLEHCLEI
ncbi:amidohydrolase family protein [candidate division KSB1 bacterium]|nr:amidohydrolase family protein [candidate division KSB1 bacterium]